MINKNVKNKEIIEGIKDKINKAISTNNAYQLARLCATLTTTAKTEDEQKQARDYLNQRISEADKSTFIYQVLMATIGHL